MQGIVKVTAILKDPIGVWEHEQPVEYPAGAEKAITMQVYRGVLAMGLIRHIDDTEFETVPFDRISHYNVKLLTVSAADNLDMARAIANQPPAPKGKIVL